MHDSAHNHSPRSGFGTLAIIGIVVGLLLVTGIGQAIWRHSTQLGNYCRDAMLEIGFSAGMDVCEKIGQGVVGFQRWLEYQVSSSYFGDTMNLEEFSGYMARQFSSMAIGFQSPQLSGLIDNSLLHKPALDMSGISSLDRLKLSLTQGAHGNSLLQSGKTTQGLRFLQSSAAMGDVGVLSQLKLGSAYSQQGGALPTDPARARYYYSQALSSIESLERQNSPESQRLLGALPAESGQIKTQINQILAGSPH